MAASSEVKARMRLRLAFRWDDLVECRVRKEGFFSWLVTCRLLSSSFSMINRCWGALCKKLLKSCSLPYSRQVKPPSEFDNGCSRGAKIILANFQPVIVVLNGFAVEDLRGCRCFLAYRVALGGVGCWGLYCFCTVRHRAGLSLRPWYGKV